MSRLHGKTAIVTGGAHGIGRAICSLFATEGAQVFLLDIDQTEGESAAEAIRAQGKQAEFMHADLSSATSVEEAIQNVGNRVDRIDIVCCNAAYLGDFHNAQEAQSQEWERSLQVTLMGTHHVIQQTLPWMIKQEGGSIVIISSVMALVGGPDSAAYMSVKAGLLGLAKSVAYDFGSFNIRTNAICPGAIKTRISPPEGSSWQQWQIDNTLLGRIGRPEEVAYAALYLASDESQYVTGVVLPVDGGYTAK